MRETTQRASTSRLVSRANGGGRRWLLGAATAGFLLSPAARADQPAPPPPATSPTAPSGTVPSTASPAATEGPPQQATGGQLSSKFSIDYRDPESSVPSARERDRNPLEFGYFLQDLLERAEQARKDNDQAAVIRYYRAVAKAVPDNARGWSKLCEAYETAKDRDRAIRACKYAIDRPAVQLQDYLRYVGLFLGKEGPLSAADLEEVNSVLAHLEKQGSLDYVVNELRCQVGVKQKDVAVLEACTKTLSRLAPEDPKTLVFAWSLAMQKGQRAEAERLIDRAVKAGVVLDSIERMRKVTATLGRGPGRLVLPATVTALVAALIVTAIRRRRRAAGA